ncbi:DUF305 domain-containing protein [Nocardioides albidus]|uniref:DUF305 domain-containing protein n=1 Tax=Nocardioides albidus TaxID=1517589 RepID=A0A5C4VRB6_9ACTN|nr:DUF305 domain-containing protein [Nocardioides albidus]TNM38341.1 DUF305 domain-containing protein [Nocardioides albidus]
MRPERGRTRRRLACAAGAVALAAGLVGCGDDGGHDDHREPAAIETARNGDVFNTADVEFATMMIPHHAQALQMALMAQDRPLSPELRALVDQIQAAQTPEVETMTTWLTDWDKEIPPTSMDHVHGGHHGEGAEMPEDMATMPGMMSTERMEELEDSSDTAFPELWMTMMIEHHEGAITMARTEQEDGRFADAIALAESIEEAQAAEIDTMEDLLGE